MRAPFPTPATESQWAVDYLDDIPGAAPVNLAAGPATNDPRVKWLDAWETDEATFGEGNIYNPLDVMPVWSSGGAPTVTSLGAGLSRTLQTMQQPFDAPILDALKDPSSSLTQLAQALAESNWSGYGQGSPQEVAYVYGGGPYGGGIVSDLAAGNDVQAPPNAAADLASINIGALPAAGWDLVTGNLSGAAAKTVQASGIGGTLGKLALELVLTLGGVGVMVYGFTLFASRGGSSSSPAASPAKFLAEHPEVAAA